MCPPAKVNGVWPFNDAWLRTSLEEARRQAPRNVASILDSARELGIRDAQAVRASGDAEVRGTDVVPARPWPDGGGGAASGAPPNWSSVIAVDAPGKRRIRCVPWTRTASVAPGGQTPGATQRCLKPGCSERIGNSRRTGVSTITGTETRRRTGSRRSAPPESERGEHSPSESRDASSGARAQHPRSRRAILAVVAIAAARAARWRVLASVTVDRSPLSA